MGVRQDTNEKGTAVSKTYQKNMIDSPNALEFAVPEQISVVMNEIAADMREGLLALAVGAGLQVMTVMMDADVMRAPARRASTIPNGSPSGTVTTAGR